MRSALAKGFAVLMAVLLAAALAYYPANKILLAGAVTAYAAFLWHRRHGWLLVLPALLPVLDFAPWTGWFFLEELDLVLLATVAVGYWRLGPPAAAGPPRFFLFAFGCVGVSFAIATVIGITPLAALDLNAFANYTSHYNGLRIAKGFAWAALLLPLLCAAADPDPANVRRLFVPGMLLGLTGACLAIVWERATFPGVLNFSADYRPTAPFSAMHTGGAALDAYLAISFPFVAFWLLGAQPRSKTMLALLLLLLGCFAGMAIFSRDVYVAYAVSGGVIGALALIHRASQRELAPLRALASAVLLALAAFLLVQVFSSSGYRGLAAALILLGAAVLMGGAAPRYPSVAVVVLTAVVLGLFDGALFMFVGANSLGLGIGKGPYLGFIISAVVFGLAMLVLLFGAAALGRRSFAVAAGAFPCVALAAVLVAYHWGGVAALTDAGWTVAFAFALVAFNRLMVRPLWTLDQATLKWMAGCAIVFATLVPLAGSYYLGTRFATVGDDFDVRVRHWNEAAAMVSPDLASSAFGMGLGRYPETYRWKNTHGEMPGTFSYETEAPRNQFLRLTGPQYAIGYGEVLRVLQHVRLTGASRYLLSLDVRRDSPKAGLAIGICERWLLYPQNCIGKPLPAIAADGAWHHIEIALDAGALGNSTGLPAAPTQLEMATDFPNGSVDVDNVSLRDAATGAELISNGSFSYGNDHWFFSSDRNHFPWHVKNFAVNLFFEQGWLGVATMALLMCYVGVDLVLRGIDGATDAAIFLAAIAGFMVVGVFDSLFDVPRLVLLFFLVLCVAMIRSRSALARRPRARAAGGHRAQRQADRSSQAP